MNTESKPLSPLVASLVRTLVPYLVGLVLALAAKANLDLPEALATEVVTVIIGFVYYGVARILETRGQAAWGWLLGLPKLPTYEATAKIDPESPTGESAGPSSDVAEQDEPVESIAVEVNPSDQSLSRSPEVDADPPGLDEPEIDEPSSEEFGSKPPA